MKESERQRVFNVWVKMHRALLFKVIRTYAFHPADQDDLFQEACLQVWRSIPNFQGKSAETTWLYRIALNTAIKWSTKEKKHVDGHEAVDKMIHVLQINEKSHDDRVAWLYNEIQQFNEIDRSLTLLLLDGLSYKEMSEIMGISQSNIGVKIHRIKKQLVDNAKKYDNATF